MNSEFKKEIEKHVENVKTWEQLMHVENVHVGFLTKHYDVEEQIVKRSGRWSSDEMKKMVRKKNVESYRILKPNNEETHSFVRAQCSNLCIVKCVDGREKIYIKLYNEEAHDLWWYLVDESDLIGLFTPDEELTNKMNDMTHEDFNNEFENMIVAPILDRWIDFFRGGNESGEVNYRFNDAKDKGITYEISIGFDFNTREWWGGVFIEGCPGNGGGGLCPSVYGKPCDAIDAIEDRIWEMISEAKNNK